MIIMTVTKICLLIFSLRYIRINPTRWRDRISMRVELVGCTYVAESLNFDGQVSFCSPVWTSIIKNDYKTAHPDGEIGYLWKCIAKVLFVLNTESSNHWHFAFGLILGVRYEDLTKTCFFVGRSILIPLPDKPPERINSVLEGNSKRCARSATCREPAHS